MIPRIPLEEMDAVNPSFDYSQPHIYFASADKFYEKAIKLIDERSNIRVLDKVFTKRENQESQNIKNKSYLNFEPLGHLEFKLRNMLETLFEKDFTNSDRMLMLTGSEKNRMNLAQMLYGKQQNNNEERRYVKDKHEILTTSYDKSLGRSLCFDHANNSIHGIQYNNNGARFTALNLDLIREISAEHKNPSLMIEEISYN